MKDETWENFFYNIIMSFVVALLFGCLTYAILVETKVAYGLEYSVTLIDTVSIISFAVSFIFFVGGYAVSHRTIEYSFLQSRTNKIEINDAHMDFQTGKIWYQTPTAIVLFLIFFFPVGIYLMWKHNAWSKTTRLIVSAVFALAVVANAGKNESTNLSNSGSGSSGYGDASCQYAVEANIHGAGGTINGISHKGNGVFEALVVSSTTNWKYKYVLIYTDADCNVINVVVK